MSIVCVGSPVTISALQARASGALGIRYVENLVSPSNEIISLAHLSALTDPQKHRLTNLESLLKQDAIGIVEISNFQFKCDLLRYGLRDGERKITLPGRQTTMVKTAFVKVQEEILSTLSWQGEGEATGISLIMRGDGALGTVVQGAKVYVIQPLGGGMHAVFSQPQLLQDHRADVSMSVGPAFGALTVPTAAALPFRIDALVAWTPRVEQELGSEANVRDLIALAELQVNTSFAMSGVNGNLRVVKAMAVRYQESNDFKTDLARFRALDDGYMDEIHSERNSSRADVCFLLAGGFEPGGLSAGVGMGENYAFSIVHYQFATSDFCFAHELGHLFGARHNIQQDPAITPYPDAHGYVAPNQWRTIMSYSSGCGCNRLPYWSNPALSVLGGPAGDQNANNARILNITGSTVAAFR